MRGRSVICNTRRSRPNSSSAVIFRVYCVVLSNVFVTSKSHLVCYVYGNRYHSSNSPTASLPISRTGNDRSCLFCHNTFYLLVLLIFERDKISFMASSVLVAPSSLDSFRFPRLCIHVSQHNYRFLCGSFHPGKRGQF